MKLFDNIFHILSSLLATVGINVRNNQLWVKQFIPVLPWGFVGGGWGLF